MAICHVVSHNGALMKWDGDLQHQPKEKPGTLISTRCAIYGEGMQGRGSPYEPPRLTV